MIALAVSSQLGSVTGIVNTVDWSKPTWDLFLVLIIPAATILYGMALGRDRIIVIMVSLYMALAVVKSVPQQIIIADWPAIRISAYVGIALILFFLLSRSALHRTIASADDRGSWWQILFFSILQAGLLISTVVSFLPHSSLASLQPMTQQIFAVPGAQFAWIVAPILGMFLLKGAKKDKKFKYDI